MFKCPKCGHKQETIIRVENYEMSHPSHAGILADVVSQFECGHLLYTNKEVEEAYMAEAKT